MSFLTYQRLRLNSKLAPVANGITADRDFWLLKLLLPEIRAGEHYTGHMSSCSVRRIISMKQRYLSSNETLQSFLMLGRNTLTNKDDVWICPSDQSNLGLDSTNQGF